MTKLHDIEESEKSTPILCIFGEEENLIEEFLKENSTRFRIIFCSKKRPEFLEDYPEIYFLTYKNVELLPKLQEQLNYVLIFLTSQHSQEQLLPLMDKLARDHAQTLVVSNPQSIKITTPILKKLKEISLVRFSVLGEILTPNRKSEGNLSKIIENAILNGTIRFYGNESCPAYGFTLRDSLYGISRLLFGNFRKETVHYLFYKHPETMLESAHLIAKVEPDTSILFSDVKNIIDTLTRDELKKIVTEDLGMEESYVETEEGFESGIQSLFRKREELEQSVLNRVKNKRISKRKKRNFNKALHFAFLSLFVGGFLFVFLNLLFLGLGILYLQSAINGIRSSNLTHVEQDAKISNYFLSSIRPTIELSLEAAATIDSKGKASQTFWLLQKGVELSKIAGSTFLNLQQTKPLTEVVLSSSLSNLSYLYQEGQRISLRMDNKELTQELKSNYSNLLSLSQILPIILGFESPQNYLLLFQNDEELRPTGGFIGSIGDLSIRNGKVEKLTIQDVYELDGQLKNHVEPPFIVRRYLQPHLFLRDSNFSLNFQESASKSALIYNLETGNKPDAVIAIDLQVLRKILKLSGPISLPSYNVTVNSDTISQFIQSTIKDNFFPGSTQKRDVLNSVFTQLIQKTENDPKFYLGLIKLLPELLEQKDVLISFSDSSIQRLFSANRYGGNYADTRNTSSKVINDYLYINEANIGVNKVNPSITREVIYRAMIGQDSLTSQASLMLSNASKTDDYLVYLTFVSPKGSILKQITINGIKQKITAAVTDAKVYEETNFKAPEELETEQFTKDNLSHVAFVAKVIRGDKTVIMVDYTNSATRPISTIAKYSLLYVKQPGTPQYNITTTFDYPEGYTPVNSSANSYGKNFLEKTTTINKNLEVEFELQKRQK